VLIVGSARTSKADCAPRRTAILSVGGSLVTSARLSVDDLAQSAGDLHQQSRLTGSCYTDPKLTGVHAAIEEDRQASTGAFRDAGNKARKRRGVCAIDPTQRFSRNRAAILEIANGNEVSLVHGRSCLLMPAAMADHG